MASENGKERRGFRITGRVQGVGFRWWTRKTAQELGLRGTVRNRRDGSVEIHARGPDEAMERFRRKLRRGPTSARVREVEEIDSSGTLPAEFEIVR